VADTQLILGGIAFQGFEIPQKINFGGRHHITQHVLIGGDRVLDMLGPDPADIHWEGRFRGNGALTRAQAIEAMMDAGAEVALTWGGLFRMVVVSAFQPDYEKRYEIPYRITCTVSQVQAGSSLGVLASTVTSLIGSDMGALSGVIGGLP
jgi:hypothetical protein